MITEESIIKQLLNGSSLPDKEKYLLLYRDQWISKGYTDGWNSCMNTFKKTKLKNMELIVNEKNRLLDELHDEIWNKKVNGKDNIQG